MKIDVELNLGKFFSKVLAGETFYYVPSGTMWIKLSDPLVDKDDNPYNAIALDDGIPAYFEANDMVMVIPTKLVDA